MKSKEVRSWLGLYFLISTAIIGSGLLLLGGILPLDPRDANNSFQIIIPVFLGQLAVIYRWYVGHEDPDFDEEILMPNWIIIGPPIIVSLIIVATLGVMTYGNNRSASWTPSPERFNTILTFCVSILNVTTILVVGRYFEAKGASKKTTKKKKEEKSVAGHNQLPTDKA